MRKNPRLTGTTTFLGLRYLLSGKNDKYSRLPFGDSPSTLDDGAKSWFREVYRIANIRRSGLMPQLRFTRQRAGFWLFQTSIGTAQGQVTFPRLQHETESADSEQRVIAMLDPG